MVHRPKFDCRFKILSETVVLRTAGVECYEDSKSCTGKHDRSALFQKEYTCTQSNSQCICVALPRHTDRRCWLRYRGHALIEFQFRYIVTTAEIFCR